MEPIAVDAPVKVPTIPGPKPVPSVKAEPPKPDAPPVPDPVGSGWALPSRKQFTIGIAAVCSLVAGVAAVRLLSPNTPETTSAAPTQSLVSAAQTPPSTPRTNAPVEPPPSNTPDPRSGGTGFDIPAVGPGTIPLPNPDPAYRPLTPPTPTATLERTPVASNNVLPPIGPPNNVVPTIGPTPPSTPGTVAPPPDDLFKPVNANKPPQPYVPAVAPANNYTMPAVIPIGAQEPPKPAAPTTTLPLPAVPSAPASPTTLPLPDVTLPGTAPVFAPKLPDVPTTLPLPTNNAPMVPLPGTMIPASPIMPPANLVPSMNPAALPPTVTPNAGTGRTIDYTKPVNSPEVRPALTSFDVDLYDPRVGDSYESISKEFYNDTRYGAALREFNRNKALQGSGQIEVPPMHVLRKRYPQSVGGTNVQPTSFPSAPPPARPIAGSVPDNWTSPGSTSSGDNGPTFRSSAGSYRVPVGGTTLKQIAKDTLGSDARWSEIWELNKQITAPDAVLPSGTEVKLPPGAKLGL